MGIDVFNLITRYKKDFVKTIIKPSYCEFCILKIDSK
jgi:hypothetical protein